MNKVLKTVLTVLGGLLSASVFIVPIVRGIMYEDERPVMLIAVGILVLFALMAVIGIRRKARIEWKAVAQTSGVIIRARRWLGGDEHDTDVGCWFRIRYSVDRQEYQITRYVRLKFGANTKQYINRSVTVHYDPHHPKTAWAEFPWEESA
jgi:hypothetical protein